MPDKLFDFSQQEAHGLNQKDREISSDRRSAENDWSRMAI
jgi:hypothetical protein